MLLYYNTFNENDLKFEILINQIVFVYCYQFNYLILEIKQNFSLFFKIICVTLKVYLNTLL